MPGSPPVWYKSTPYWALAANDPRGVLVEFGVQLPSDTEVQVWDSTSEMCHLVLPMQSTGTQDLDADASAQLITLDSVIGTGVAPGPS